MIGVHLAPMTEVMSFYEYLGIDTDLNFVIVSHAAGASAIFVKTLQDMDKGQWPLRSMAGITEIK